MAYTLKSTLFELYDDSAIQSAPVHFRAADNGSFGYSVWASPAMVVVMTKHSANGDLDTSWGTIPGNGFEIVNVNSPPGSSTSNSVVRYALFENGDSTLFVTQNLFRTYVFRRWNDGSHDDTTGYVFLTPDESIDDQYPDNSVVGVDPSGNLIYADYFTDGSPDAEYQLRVGRFSWNGELDVTFGTGGWTIIPTGETSSTAGIGGDSYMKIAIDGDGNTVILSIYEDDGSGNALGIAHRFLADGSYDEDVGKVGFNFGAITNNFQSGQNWGQLAVTDGKFTTMVYDDLGGETELIFIRITHATLATDATFGTSGVQRHAGDGILPPTGFPAYADGLSVIEGKTYQTGIHISSSKPLALRLNANGSRDTAFGPLGVMTVDVESPLTGAAFTSTLPETGGVSFGGAGLGSIYDVIYEFSDPAPPTINRTVNKLIAVAGTKTYIGDDPGSLDGVANYGSFNMDASAIFVDAATLFGFTYLVDGTNIRKLNLATELFVSYAASAGSAPTGCTIACAWRGRLMLSGSEADPQNVFASRVGDPTDWDYGQEDSAAAWSGNAAPAGRVGEPIIALAPISDDLLLIFSDNTIYAVRGDPSDGGSIDLVTDKAGIVGPRAWTRDAQGNLYFVSANGLYKSNPDGSGAVEISRDVYRQFFQSTNRSTRHTTLVYDPARYGIWIFVAPDDQPTTADTSLFYDIRMEGFWPIRFTNSQESGPLTAIYWDGFEDSSRFPLLGGYAGQLDSMNFSNRRDNGNTIDASFQTAAFSLSQVDDAILTRLDVTGGETKTGDDDGVWQMGATIYGGDTAYSVTEGTPRHTVRVGYGADERGLTKVVRIRGGWFSIHFANTASGNYFTFEQATAHVLPAGNQR